MPWKVILKTVGLLLLLLVFPAAGGAQEPSKQEPSKQEPSKDDKKPQATSQNGPEKPQGLRSFVGDAMENVAHKVGFTLNANEIYQNSLFNSGLTRQRVAATSFYPRVFFNLGRRKSRFHLDYGMSYTLYAGQRGLDTAEHYGNAQYSYQISRRASIQLSDELSSSPNSYGSLIASVLSDTAALPAASTEIFVDRQRITRNVASANFSLRLTRKSSLGLFGSYQHYQFQSPTIGKTDGVSVGASFDYQLTRWLSLSNSYSTYLNYVDQKYRDTRMHRLQVGGFTFRLGARWRATAGAGVEYTSFTGETRLTADADASLSWSSRAHSFALSYHRGFYSAIGLSTLLQSDSATAGFGSRLTKWMNLQISASYLRGSDFSGIGSVASCLGRSALDFALRRDLVASLGGLIQYQRAWDLAGLPSKREAAVAYAGLSYMFPSRAR